MKSPNFFAELKRRNVYKVAVAYAVVGWLIIQITSTVLPTFHAPEWVVQTSIILVALGFPIALVIAWAFEMTPEGLKRTENVSPSEKLPYWSTRKFAGVIALIALAAGALLAFQLLRGKARVSQPAATGAPPAKSIAVMPFDNLSDDKQNAYFADGVQDQILTKLASVADLKVISRTSTAKYKSKPEDLKTVAQELGVANVLEGTVQRSGEKVRVNVQLIDARTDTHLWAKNYDRELKDVFEVQSDISQEIADALRAKLSPIESKTLAKAPTQNAEAYDLFLRGEYERRQGIAFLTADWFERAAAFYREAFERDPRFALAAARLAESLLSVHFYSRPFAPAQLDEVKTIIDRALALDPDLAESHEALGLYHYWGYLRYDSALAAFRRALELQPNNARAHGSIGYVYRRQGKWPQSLAEIAKCEALDPLDPSIPANVALSYAHLRQWPDAKRAGSRALALDPHSVAGRRALVIAAMYGDGDVGAARKLVASFSGPLRGNLRGGLVAIMDYAPYLYVLERNYEGALKSVPELTGNDFERRQTLSAKAAIRAVGHLPADAETQAACDLLETRLRERPDDNVAMTQLGWVYLALGRKDDAVRIARKAAELLPIEKDALAGTAYATGLAEIQAQAGEAASATAQLRRLLAIPAGGEVTEKSLRLDPVWDPIRNDPEFQQLLTIKEHVGP